jgi:dTDP-4-dehydrorhamnose reductase
MRVVITGAGGLVGTALTRFYAARGEVFPLRHRELDITDSAAVDATIARLRPDLIFNCAVIGVDECEADPERARGINVAGPSLLAGAAADAGAAIVHFSTNYVFSGEDEGHFYAPDDVAEPVNVYGWTKLDGERAVAASCTRSLNIRTSWVFGPGKQSFLATAAARLRVGETVVAADDIFASATYVEDLVGRVDELLGRSVYGTFHVNNAGALNHREFAEAAAELVGLSAEETAVRILAESSPDRAARRPRWTPMRCPASEALGLAPLRGWREALAEYVGTAE